jgi:hypothetical protein
MKRTGINQSPSTVDANNVLFVQGTNELMDVALTGLPINGEPIRQFVYEIGDSSWISNHLPDDTGNVILTVINSLINAHHYGFAVYIRRKDLLHSTDDGSFGNGRFAH